MNTIVWPHRKAAASYTTEGMRMQVPVIQARTIRIIMAGGGTGGHLYPGLAVAEVLEEKLGKQLELIWAATPRGVDQRLLGRFGERYIQQSVQPFSQNVTKWVGFWSKWTESCRFWRDYFQKYSIDGVISLGGYAAGPASYVAAKIGVPVGLLNPDAVPGRANRFLMKRADRVFSQWDLVGHGAEKIRGKLMALGCPIRESLLARTREEGAKRLGLDPGRPTLVVCGGSLAAKTINDAMMMMLKDKAVVEGLRRGGWQVIHLAGSEQAVGVKAAYEPIKDVTWIVLDYCDDMASVWAVGDLALARAGASTCAELTACGVPSILLPYPFHRDQHQRHNAMKLVEAGAAVMAEDLKEAGANAGSLKGPVMEMLSDRGRRGVMAAKARAAGKPGASRGIAEEMLKVINDEIRMTNDERNSND